MSIARLQEKIRRCKNPTLLHLELSEQMLPPEFLTQGSSLPRAFAAYSVALLEQLQGLIPAVRVGFAGYALMGTEGLNALSRVLETARGLGYYVILEVPDALTAEGARFQAENLFTAVELWPFDSLLLSSYIGSDGIKPYATGLEKTDKGLFVVARTGNRSAGDVQDLLTGSRNVFEAVADLVCRYQGGAPNRSGYDRIGAVGTATSPAVLKKLREKYRSMFLLVDGYDLSGWGKRCAEAFDALGHGAIVSVGRTITGAWTQSEYENRSAVEAAQEAAKRVKMNFARNFTVL